MRTRILNLLLAAVLVLAGARLWTALRAPPPQVPPVPAAGPAAVAEAAPAEPAEATPSAAGAEGYDIIVARDLFSAARGVVPPAPPAATKPAPKPPAQPKLTLSGVVVVDGEKTAYLQEGTAETKPRKVREGDAFAGGTVKLIRPDGITFVFSGSEITVPLRTPKDAGAAARAGDVSVAPVQPDGMPRRVTQPGVPDVTGQVRRPPQVVPGVPRLIPPPDEEEPIYEDDAVFEDEEGMEIIDEGEMLDEEEFPPEEFEEPVE